MYEENDLESYKSILKNLFFSKISEKNSWGKNEALQAFDLVMKDAEIELLKRKLIR